MEKSNSLKNISPDKHKEKIKKNKNKSKLNSDIFFKY